ARASSQPFLPSLRQRPLCPKSRQTQQRARYVRFVPKADIRAAAKSGAPRSPRRREREAWAECLNRVPTACSLALFYPVRAEIQPAKHTGGRLVLNLVSVSYAAAIRSSRAS